MRRQQPEYQYQTSQKSRLYNQFINLLQNYVQNIVKNSQIQLSNTRTTTLFNLITKSNKSLTITQTRARVQQLLNSFPQPYSYVPYIQQHFPQLTSTHKQLDSVNAYLTRAAGVIRTLLQNVYTGLGQIGFTAPRLTTAQRDAVVQQISAPLFINMVPNDGPRFLCHLIASQLRGLLIRLQMTYYGNQTNLPTLIETILQTVNFQYLSQRAGQQLPAQAKQKQYWINIYTDWRRIQALNNLILPVFKWQLRRGTRKYPNLHQAITIDGSKLKYFENMPQTDIWTVNSLRDQLGVLIQQFTIQQKDLRQKMNQLDDISQQFQNMYQQIPKIKHQQQFPFQRIYGYIFCLALYRQWQQFRFYRIFSRQQQLFQQSSMLSYYDWLDDPTVLYCRTVLQLSKGFKSFNFQHQLTATKQQLYQSYVQNFDFIVNDSINLARQAYVFLKQQVAKDQNDYIQNQSDFRLGHIVAGSFKQFNLWDLSMDTRLTVPRMRKQRQYYQTVKAVFFPGQRWSKQVDWYVFSDKQQIQADGIDFDYVRWLKSLDNNLLTTWGHRQSKLCWAKVLSYAFTVIHPFDDVRLQIAKMFRQGKLWQAIDQILHYTGWGFYNNLQRCRNQVKQQKVHLYLQGRHLTILSWKQIKRRQSQVYQKRVMNTSRIVLDRNKKPHYLSLNPNLFNPQFRIKQWNQRQISLPRLPLQSFVDQIIWQRTLFVDIQCLSVEQTKQRCYLAVAVGCPSHYCSQSQFVYWDSDQYTAADNLVGMIYSFWRTGIYTKQQPLTIWFFNGLKYQMAYFYQYIKKLWGVVQSFGQPSQSKGFSVGDGAVVFRDVRTILSIGTLKELSKTFAKSKSQEKQDFDITKIVWQSDIHQQKTKQQIIKYCKQDCYSLAFLVRNLYNKLYQINNQLHLKTKRPRLLFHQIYNKYTAPGIAVLFMFHFFLQNHFNDNQPQQVKILQRVGYYGGITQIFKHVIDQPFESYDINSSYPAAMIQQMPWFYQRPLTQQQCQNIYTNRSKWGQRDPLDFLQIQSFDHKGSFPWIPYKHKTGLIYNNSQKSTIQYIWARQLIFCKDTQIKVIRGWRYSNKVPCGQHVGVSINMTRQYINYFYPQKSQYKKQGNIAMQTLIKLFLNSPYGKLAQRLFNSCVIVQDQWMMQVGTLHKTSQISWGTMISQLPKCGSTIGDFVRVASYISAYGRAHLACVANQVGIQNVYYCDTDSLYVKKGTFPKMRMHDSRLGGWKHQYNFTKGIFVAPKCSILYTTNISKKTKNQIGWVYKWKGVPLRCFQKVNPDNLYNDLRKDIFGIAQINPIPYNQYKLMPVLASQRWMRGNGIIIQNFWRQTSIWIKKVMNKDTSLRSFNV